MEKGPVMGREGGVALPKQAETRDEATSSPKAGYEYAASTLEEPFFH